MIKSLEQLRDESVALRSGSRPIVLTDALTEWLEHAMQGGVIPQVRTRKGRIIGVKLNGVSITTRGSVMMGYQGPLADLSSAMNEACTALHGVGLIQSARPQYMGALSTELCIRSGVHRTMPALQGQIGDALRTPAGRCAGKVAMFQPRPYTGVGRLVALDLVQAYGNAAADSAPCNAHRNASRGWVESNVMDLLASGRFSGANEWRQEPPSHRALCMVTATPPTTISAWNRPLPQRPEGATRWLWSHAPYRGPLWDATIDELRRVGWKVKIGKSWAWKVGRGWRHIFDLVKRALRECAKLARKVVKLAMLRAVGMLAYKGPDEYAVVADTPQKRDLLPQGARVCHHHLGIWSCPMEESEERPRTYRPHIAQAIWAWSRRELSLHAAQAMGAHTPIAMYVDSVWTDRYDCETDRLKVKEEWDGHWQVPHAGALQCGGEWIYRPGVGRALIK